MYRFLLTRRWLAFHALVLLIIPSFFFLGRWQLGRYEARSAASDVATRNLASAPVPLTALDRPGGDVPYRLRFRGVTVTGRYDATHQLLARRRVQNGQPGYYVLTPLVTADGSAVLVNRGWVEMGPTAESLPEVPAPPSGEVNVTGRLRQTETEDNTGITDRPGLPAGQVWLINTVDIGKSLPYRLYGGYVELTGQQPDVKPAPEPVPDPDLGGGGGLNLAYAVQWWLFIGIAIGGWFTLIRREARDLRAAEDEPATDVGSPSPAEPSRNRDTESVPNVKS